MTELDFTIFAYDITTVVDGSIDTEYDTETPVNTPVGWVNQDGMAANGTTTFKVAKKVNGASLAADSNIAAFDKDSTILIKMGGTGIETPAAKIFSFANAEEVQGFQGTYGDVDGDNKATNRDAITVMRSHLSLLAEPLTPEQIEAADVNGDDKVTNIDAILIMRRHLSIITQFPIEEEQ